MILIRASTIAAGAWAVAQVVRAPRAISFAGRTAVITGGSRGLGLLVARRLVAESARVALLARTEEDLDVAAAELGESALPVVCDVRDRAAVGAAIAETVERFGPPSVLLHDAGVISVGPEAHMDAGDYAESLGVHFWGAYHVTEAVRPHLPRDGSAGRSCSRRTRTTSRSPAAACSRFSPGNTSRHTSSS